MSNYATRVFTSESVTAGHPDKICDRVSDTILDAILDQDPLAHVAVETLATTGLIHVAGEVTTTGYVEIPELVRQSVCQAGYVSSAMGFDGNSCGVSVSIGQQSPNIAAAVDKSLEVREDDSSDFDTLDFQGAGDQGIMFGYACRETPDLMPLPIWLSHRLARRLEQVRRNGQLDYLYPDGKTQVTIAYEDDRPVSIDTVVVSSQHRAGIDLASLRSDIIEVVIQDTLMELDLDIDLDIDRIKMIVNPAGEFIVGGPKGDAGLTGRKIIVDTYGGAARHGGGAFSGKDPSKVDRSGAYAMRWVAKNIVAANLASRCELQVAYAIGKANPVGLFVETFGTHTVAIEQIQNAIGRVFDLRPAAIISDLDLRRPIYAQTAAYGHFGRAEFSWEQTNRVDELLAAL